jgi:hypothetical protein
VRAAGWSLSSRSTTRPACRPGRAVGLRADAHCKALATTAGAGSKTWNSSHGTRGCGTDALKATGGAGLLYCFAAD